MKSIGQQSRATAEASGSAVHNKTNEFSAELAGANPEIEAWEMLLRFADSLGVRHMHTWFGTTLDETVFNSTCPDWWMPHYLKHDFWTHDTLGHHCMTGHGPTIYGVDRTGRTPHETEETENILNFMKATIDLGSGVGFPVFMPDGTRIGGVNIGFSGTLEDLDKLPTTDVLAGMMAATATHTRSHALRNGDIRTPRLSPRERECLLFLAAGMRTKEISQKLNLSDATVAFHISNAKRKLGADTREQAVARAIVLGAISP